MKSYLMRMLAAKAAEFIRSVGESANPLLKVGSVSKYSQATNLKHSPIVPTNLCVTYRVTHFLANLG